MSYDNEVLWVVVTRQERDGESIRTVFRSQEAAEKWRQDHEDPADVTHARGPYRAVWGPEM